MSAGATGRPPGASRAAILAWLAAILVASVVASVMVGSVRLSPWDVLRGLVEGGSQDTAATIVRKIRLPRTLLAGIVGACLSVAGLGFQAISRNPLADPSVLGVSSGAAFGLLSVNVEAHHTLLDSVKSAQFVEVNVT